MKKKFPWRWLILGFLIAFGALTAFLVVPFAPHQTVPSVSSTTPLDPTSPWPKFRSDLRQTGRSVVQPVAEPGSQPWVFPTGKGIFSSPVADAEGRIYIGSADQRFYALDRDGRLAWSALTGGVIDSSAALDNENRVIVGSGDGSVYAFDRRTGGVLWVQAADSPETAKSKYGLEIHNVGWFEGNIGLLPDGTVLAPNDNQLVYALDRTTGREKRVYRGNEMIWSLPAVDSVSGRLYFATQNLALKTVFAYDLEASAPRWTAGNLGSVAASLLLTAPGPDALLIGGAFDGYVRAWEASTGKQVWEFAARDHIYASPGQLSDGTLVQPSADGTVYALDPVTGKLRWSFDTGEPVRSSPAIDGRDQIYFGGGDGRLYCLNADGTLRWVWQCIPGQRNDLNSSPALAPGGVVLGGEDGGVHFVPYDYPLTPAGKADSRSAPGPRPSDDVATLVRTSPFGDLSHPVTGTLDANAPLTFTLVARRAGATVAAGLDPADLTVKVSGPDGTVKVRVQVSADTRFVTLLPEPLWLPSSGGELEVSLTGSWRSDFVRFGLKAFGGTKAGTVSETFRFQVEPRSASPLPYTAPRQPGDAASRFALARFAAPNPTMLPSWNQIGFDSLHYVAGVLRTDGNQALVWAVGGRLDPATGSTVVDPSLQARFPLDLRWDGGLVTLENRRGFLTNFVGSWAMPFGDYRIAAKSGASGELIGAAALNAVALGDQIPFYGLGLKLLGLTDWNTGHLTVAGGLDWHTLAPAAAPEGSGRATFRGQTTNEGGKPGVRVSAVLEGSSVPVAGHLFSVVVLGPDNEVLPLDYTGKTTVRADAAGHALDVSVAWEGGQQGNYTAYYVVDAVAVNSGPVVW